MGGKFSRWVKETKTPEYIKDTKKQRCKKWTVRTKMLIDEFAVASTKDYRY